MVRLTEDQGQWLHDLLAERGGEGDPLFGGRRLSEILYEQLQARNHSEDLVETVARIIGDKRKGHSLSGESLEQLRKSVLSPRELAIFKAQIDSGLVSCNNCGNRIQSHELCSFYNGHPVCVTCYNPRYVACKGKHVLTLPSHFMKIINKLFKECPTCKKGAEHPVENVDRGQFFTGAFLDAVLYGFNHDAEWVEARSTDELSLLQRNFIDAHFLTEDGDRGENLLLHMRNRTQPRVGQRADRIEPRVPRNILTAPPTAGGATQVAPRWAAQTRNDLNAVRAAARPGNPVGPTGTTTIGWAPIAPDWVAAALDDPVVVTAAPATPTLQGTTMMDRAMMEEMRRVAFGGDPFILDDGTPLVVRGDDDAPRNAR